MASHEKGSRPGVRARAASEVERRGAVLLHSTPPPVPCVLLYEKYGRLRTVGKLVEVEGEVVLGVCWRHQTGTQRAVSLPPSALQLARAGGAKLFVLRIDRLRRAFGCSLGEFERAQPAADGESYVPLSALTPKKWPAWEYVTEPIITLPAAAGAPQLPLLPGLDEGVRP